MIVVVVVLNAPKKNKTHVYIMCRSIGKTGGPKSLEPACCLYTFTICKELVSS